MKIMTKAKTIATLRKDCKSNKDCFFCEECPHSIFCLSRAWIWEDISIDRYPSCWTDSNAKKAEKHIC